MRGGRLPESEPRIDHASPTPQMPIASSPRSQMEPVAISGTISRWATRLRCLAKVEHARTFYRQSSLCEAHMIPLSRRYNTTSGPGGAFLRACLSGAVVFTLACGSESPAGPGGPGAPTVSISAPAAASEIVGIFSVELVGTATDPQDGDLTSSIVWRSDVDGGLGTGGTVQAALSAGAHTVTATVVDRDGSTGSADVSFSVVVPTTYAHTLEAPSASDLYVMDIAALGSDTRIGTVQTASGDVVTLTDMAISPDGDLFACTSGALYSVNPATAFLTEIGRFNDNGMVGLAFDDAGTLYGSTGTGQLVTINTATASTSVVGTFGSGIIGDGDLAFTDSGQLWGSMYQGGESVMATIDVSSGAATVFAPTGERHIWALVFDEGSLFGFASGPSSDFLVSIDQTDGSVTHLRAVDVKVGGAG